MWKARPEEKPSGSAAPAPSTTNIGTNTNLSAVSSSNTSAPAAVAARPAFAAQRTGDNFRAEVAHIGKSVLIKGELSGSEDLYLDGEVEGNMELHHNVLTIGPNGRIRAHVHAKEVSIDGKVDGNIRGTEKVVLKRNAALMG